MNVVNSLISVRMETASMLPEASHVSAFQDLDRHSIVMDALVWMLNFGNFKETDLLYFLALIAHTAIDGWQCSSNFIIGQKFICHPWRN